MGLLFKSKVIADMRENSFNEHYPLYVKIMFLSLAVTSYWGLYQLVFGLNWNMVTVPVSALWLGFAALVSFKKISYRLFGAKTLKRHGGFIGAIYCFIALTLALNICLYTYGTEKVAFVDLFFRLTCVIYLFVISSAANGNLDHLVKVFVSNRAMRACENGLYPVSMTNDPKWYDAINDASKVDYLLRSDRAVEAKTFLLCNTSAQYSLFKLIECVVCEEQKFVYLKDGRLTFKSLKHTNASCFSVDSVAGQKLLSDMEAAVKEYKAKVEGAERPIGVND